MNGIMDAFLAFFNAYNMHWAIYFIGFSIILGSAGVAQSWIISISRSLHIALVDTHTILWLHKKNEFGMPYRILLLQGALFSIMVTGFIWMPTINSSYWFFSALTSQYNLMFYVLLFSAAIYLRRKRSENFRFGKSLGPFFGIFLSLAGIIVGF